MTGLWFEYLWDKGFDDNMDYKCSMWTVLEDDTKYVAFNHMHFSEDDGKFSQVDLHWTPKTAEGHQPQSLVFNRAKSHSTKDDEYFADKTIHVAFSDYYSHLIGQTCQELPGGKHQTDYFVWTREK